jgi:hypothetical protein
MIGFVGMWIRRRAVVRGLLAAGEDVCGVRARRADDGMPGGFAGRGSWGRGAWTWPVFREWSVADTTGNWARPYAPGLCSGDHPKQGSSWFPCTYPGCWSLHAAVASGGSPPIALAAAPRHELAFRQWSVANPTQNRTRHTLLVNACSRHHPSGDCADSAPPVSPSGAAVA